MVSLWVCVDIVNCDQKCVVKEICSLNGGQGKKKDGEEDMDFTSPSGLYLCFNSFLLMDKIPWARLLTEGRVYLGSQLQRDKTLLWKKSRQQEQLRAPISNPKQEAESKLGMSTVSNSKTSPAVTYFLQ